MPKARLRPSTGCAPSRELRACIRSMRSSTTSLGPATWQSPRDISPKPRKDHPMTPVLRTTTARPALHGALTALVTPFTADGSVDETALRRLVRWQVLAGIDGLVPVG